MKIVYLLFSALILALIGYAIIYFFGLRGTITWVVYGCVIGIPLVVIPFITNKPPPDLVTAITKAWSDDGAGVFPRLPPLPRSRESSFSDGGRRHKYGRNKKRS
jgi:hypothetical protein